jgi:Raf kinase inhibitor-like YbhB/YbcL family protein
MRITTIGTHLKILGAGVICLAATLAAQTPPPNQPPPQNPPAGAQPPPPGRGGRGGGQGAIQIMTLTSSAWTDGAVIPIRHSQVADPELSPPLAWTGVPDGVASFTLLVRDLDALRSQGGTTSEMLHWLVWNIPGTARSLPEGVPAVAELPDGARQISGTGPYYRGPGAPASGPTHHYVFELYALDAMLDVPAVGASPAETRAAVMAAMNGRIRAKGVLVGLFRRS